MPRRDDAAVVLPVEGGRAKVDQLHPGVPHPPEVALRRRAVLRAPVGRDEQDVLRLQVGVGEVVVVQELDKKGKLGLLHRSICQKTMVIGGNDGSTLSLHNLLHEWLPSWT